MQSGKPAIREPTPCGRDGYPSVGREPSQLGWYDFVARRHKGESVIDVGAGTCCGMAYMRFLGCDVQGFDVDERLTLPGLVIGPSPLLAFGDQSCDVVASLDVIEHVVDDLPFMAELKAMARKAVYVTTPNFNRSHAANEHHAREYTIAEFAETFRPDEIWVGSPSGWYGKMLLPWPCAENYRAPDGHAWPHFCGVFYR